MIVVDRETAGRVVGEHAEAVAHALADRLQGLEARGPACGVDADALGAVVIDGDEHRDLGAGAAGRLAPRRSKL